MTPILRKRIDFENFDIVYPAVPQQNNTYVKQYLYTHGCTLPFLLFLSLYFYFSVLLCGLIVVAHYSFSGMIVVFSLLCT